MKAKISLYLMMAAMLVTLQNCGKSTESTIIQTDNSLFSGYDSTQIREQVSQKGDDFVQLTVGEPGVIETIDPLFAQSDSELRLLNLVYDGLTKLDETGQIVPALARSWELSADSLEYTFHLRTNVYFHNSSKFSSSLGRKFSAKDVEFVIKRAASSQVPTYSAKLFKDIKGFVEYFIEQQTIKNPVNRTITDIVGLKIHNDSTITISLNQKNEDFIKNLAHPHSSVYAAESLPKSGGPILEPIGTGAFYYAKKEANKIIFASNKRYFSKKNRPDRLDIVSGLNETDLFKEFGKGNIDAIINLGPRGIDSAVDSTGNLTSAYRDVYDLKKTDIKNKYTLYYNPESMQPEAVDLVANSVSKGLGGNTTIGEIKTVEIKDEKQPDWDGIITAYTHNPFELYLVGTIAENLKDKNIKVGLNKSRALFNNVTFTFNPQENLMPVVEWEVPIHIITQKDLKGINLWQESWNIGYSDIEKPEKN